MFLWSIVVQAGGPVQTGCLSRVVSRAERRDERVPRSSMGQGAKSKHIEQGGRVAAARIAAYFHAIVG